MKAQFSKGAVVKVHVFQGAIWKAQVSQGAVGNEQCLVLSESTSSQGAVGNALFCLDAGMQSNAGMQSSSWSVASMQ